MYRSNDFRISPGGDGGRSPRTTEQSPHRHLGQHRQDMQQDIMRADYAHEQAIRDIAKRAGTMTRRVEIAVAEPDTYMQIIKEKSGVRDERLQGPSECVSSLSIRSAIPEADHFCGRGTPQSGQWCATTLWQ